VPLQWANTCQRHTAPPAPLPVNFRVSDFEFLRPAVRDLIEGQQAMTPRVGRNWRRFDRSPDTLDAGECAQRRRADRQVAVKVAHSLTPEGRRQTLAS